MSVLNLLLPCPCRTWRCRLYYAARMLAALAALYVGYRLGSL